jgi:hypothetical protein
VCSGEWGQAALARSLSPVRFVVFAHARCAPGVQLQAVSVDLLRLMRSNSLARFMRTRAWADYLAGKPPPQTLHIEAPGPGEMSLQLHSASPSTIGSRLLLSRLR